MPNPHSHANSEPTVTVGDANILIFLGVSFCLAIFELPLFFFSLISDFTIIFHIQSPKIKKRL